MQTLIS